MTKSRAVRNRSKAKKVIKTNFESSLQRLKGEYNELEADHMDRQKKYMELEDDHKSLILLNERLARVNAESAELMVKLEEKNIELRKLNERLAEANASTAVLMAELEDKNETLIFTNDQLARANAHAGELMAIIELKNEEIEKLNMSLSKANARGANLIADRELNLDKMRLLNKKLSSEIKVRETTEKKLKRTMEKLHEKNKELDEFNRTLSHDLKNPLTNIYGSANLIKTEYSDKLDEEGREFVDNIVTDCKRMVKLIDVMLQFSKIEKLDDENIFSVNVNSVLRDVLTTLRSKINEKLVDIDYPKQMPDIIYNPSRINHVFNNLIGNSIKYIGPQANPRIKIDYEEKLNKYIFKVSDNGIGIKKEDLEDIFIPFKRGSDMRSIEGSGIGLSIVKKIVESHGGRIWVNSKEGEGSTFKFTVPKINK